MTFVYRSMLALLMTLGWNVRPVAARPQEPIHVGPNVQVSTDHEKDILVESSVAVNPTDPSNLILAAVRIDAEFARTDPGTTPATGGPPHGAWRSTVFVSRDSGETWIEVDLGRRYDWASAGDPWVTFGPEGTAYFATLPGDSAFLGLDRPDALALAVFRSEDGGASWSYPMVAPYGDPLAYYDHVVLDVDHSDGPRRGALYVGATAAWTDDTGWSLQAPAVLRSDDGGRTFSTIWRRPQTNLLGGLHDLKVRSDGTVVTVFGDGARKHDKGGADVDFDFSPRLTAFLSRDGGRTFPTGYIVSNAQTIGQWDDMAIDRSGGDFHDRIYFTWAQSMRGDQKGVYVLHTPDGHSWSDAVKVAPAQEGTWVGVSAAAVNGAGVLGVLWHQRAAGADGIEQHTWFAASWDGGQTFSEPVRVSSKASLPENARNGMTSRRFPAGGDYVGLAGSRDGAFHAAWADARDSTFQIYSSRIEVLGQATEGGG